MKTVTFKTNVGDDISQTLGLLVAAVLEKKNELFYDKQTTRKTKILFVTYNASDDMLKVTSAYDEKLHALDGFHINDYTSSVHVAILNGKCSKYEKVKQLIRCIYAYDGYLLVNEVKMDSLGKTELVFLKNLYTCKKFNALFRLYGYWKPYNGTIMHAQLLQDFVSQTDSCDLIGHVVEHEFLNGNLVWRLFYSKSAIIQQLVRAEADSSYTCGLLVDNDNDFSCRFKLSTPDVVAQSNADVIISAEKHSAMSKEFFEYVRQFMFMAGYVDEDSDEPYKLTHTFVKKFSSMTFCLKNDKLYVNTSNDSAIADHHEFEKKCREEDIFKRKCMKKRRAYLTAASLGLAALAWIGCSMYSAHCSNVQQQLSQMRSAYASLVK